MRFKLLLILSALLLPLYISAQNADFGDAPDNQKWWGGTAIFPTLRASNGPMHTQASESTFWIGNKESRGSNTTTLEPDAKLINRDEDDGRPFIFILLIGIPAPAEITVPITTSASHDINTNIYVNVAIDVDNDLDFNDNPDINWVVQNQMVNCPADTTLGFNFGPFGFGNDLLLLPVWVRITLTDEPISSPWNGMGKQGGWTLGETEDWYFGSKGTKGNNSRKANNAPSDSLPTDSIPPQIPQSEPDPEKCVKLIYPKTIYVKCDEEKCIHVGVKDCGEKEVTDINLHFGFLKGTPLKVAPHVVGNPVKQGNTTWFKVCVTGWDCELQEDLRWARYKITVSYDPDGLFVIKEYNFEIGNDEFPFSLNNTDNMISRINAEALDSTDYLPWFINHGDTLNQNLSAWVGEYPGGGKWLANGQPDLVVVSKPNWVSFVESYRSNDNTYATYHVGGTPTINDNGLQYLVVQATSDDPTDNFVPWNLQIPIYITSSNIAPVITKSLKGEYYINTAQDESIQEVVNAVDYDITNRKRDTIFFDFYLWDKDSSKLREGGDFLFTSNASSANFKWTPKRSETGNYDLIMQAFDYYQAMDTTHTNAFVFHLEPEFSVDKVVGFTPFTVQFHDESIAENTDILSWEWNFEDGKYSTEQHPEHTYSMSTTFTPRLTISNGTHEMQVLKQFHIITKKVDFTSDVTQGDAPLEVNFVNLINTDLPLSITSNTMLSATYEWNWDFGDGGTSNLYNPSHTFSMPGVFDVSLQANIYIFDSSVSTSIPVDTISSAIFTKPDYIITAGDLIANFDADVYEGYSPLTVKFKDKSFGEPESWLWHFGDGDSSVSQNPTHTYKTTGAFNVSLKIKKGETENTKTINNMISVLQPLVADFSAEPTIGKSPLTVQFTDKTIGEPEPISWLWDFGDGNTSEEPNPSNTYESDGIYDVKLIASNEDATDSTTKTAYIKVGDEYVLKADFTAEPRSGDSPLSVQFTDKSNGNPTQWFWNFGDGSTENNEQNPIHIYDNSGTFSVQLIVNDGTIADTAKKDEYIMVGTVGVEDLMINSFELYQNYPNPMNENTVIMFSLENRSTISLRIYDNLGNKIQSILNSKTKNAGIHQLEWDGKDLTGKQVPSGIYYIELSIEGSQYRLTKKKEMIIVR